MLLIGNKLIKGNKQKLVFNVDYYYYSQNQVDAVWQLIVEVARYSSSSLVDVLTL